MRIAFDQQTFTWQEFGGISRYFCSLVNQLSKIPGIEPKVFAPFHINAYLPKLPSTARVGVKVTPIPKTPRIIRTTSNLLAIPLIQAFQPDIMHETYYSSNAFAPKGAKRVITAYDMIQEHCSDQSRSTKRLIDSKMKAFNRADHIICISENTRRDLMKYYDIPAVKISVVYLGFDEFTVDAQASHASHGLPYILYVGQRAGYKNFTAFIKAYAGSAWLKNNFSILCFGGGKFTSSEMELLKSTGINEAHIRQLSGGDDTLASCYANASVFVYPSLYEGFGIPPLEAMASGCPVVCSNASSIPEVVGNAGEYFVPSSIDSIRQAMLKVLQLTNRRAELITAGLERCRLFAWEKCAVETLAIYQSIL